jgi:putative sigma-54 modulation protein
VKTNLTARNIELSDRLRSQVERKLRRLDRITHPQAEASVELLVNASHAAASSQVAEVTLVNNGSVLRSSASGATLIAALDVVIDKLERQVVKTKERPRSVRDRRSDETVSVLEREATKTVEPDAAPSRAAGDGRPAVVKMKRFDMLPMFRRTRSPGWRSSGTPSSCSSTPRPRRSPCSIGAPTATTGSSSR